MLGRERAAPSAEGTSVSPSAMATMSISTTPSELSSTSLTGARMSRGPASEPSSTPNARALSAKDVVPWLRGRDTDSQPATA